MLVPPPIRVALLPGARRAFGPARGLVSPFAALALSGARARAPTPPPVSVAISISVSVSASAATPTAASALLAPAATGKISLDPLQHLRSKAAQQEVLPAPAVFGVRPADAGQKHLQLLHGISCYFGIIFIQKLLKNQPKTAETKVLSSRRAHSLSSFTFQGFFDRKRRILIFFAVVSCLKLNRWHSCPLTVPLNSPQRPCERINRLKAHTPGAGSFARHKAGNISFSLSFLVFGLTETSEAENGQAT